MKKECISVIGFSIPYWNKLHYKKDIYIYIYILTYIYIYKYIGRVSFDIEFKSYWN